MTEYRRFNLYHRVLHAIIVISFLGLVLTGMPLRYSDTAWAVWFISHLGGFKGAGLIHRICAVFTFGYFAAHIAYIVYHVAIVKKFKFNPFGPDSMVPSFKDVEDIYQVSKWFLGQGPRPQFDRWAYWEKFDYWAVFWGVGIIGFSGLFLWFPEFFGRFFPGWVFNIATVIHSDEALLASGFIFTAHFFNSHLRPEKFPMDCVIFTGRVTLHELQEERPLQYQRLVAENRLGKYEMTSQGSCAKALGVVFGTTAVVIGLVLLILIVIGQFYYH